MKLYYYIILLPITLALKVYQSNLSIINDKDTSGLHFQPQEYKSFHTKHSFSGCIRFNYKRLYKTVVLLISDANCSICTSDPSHPFFNLVAEYPNHLSFWGIGRYDLPGEPWASYLTNTPWITGIWNHLCMAYNKVSSHISVVKVCISNDKRNCQWILSCEPNQCCMFPIHVRFKNQNYCSISTLKVFKTISFLNRKVCQSILIEFENNIPKLKINKKYTPDLV